MVAIASVVVIATVVVVAAVVVVVAIVEVGSPATVLVVSLDGQLMARHSANSRACALRAAACSASGTIAVLPERRRWTGTGKLIGDHRLVDDANRIAIGAAGACRDDAGGRHDQGANTCCQERPAAAAGVDRRRLGASEMCVSHAIVHGLVGQGSEASDEVVVVHNVYIVAGSQGDMGSVEGR